MTFDCACKDLKRKNVKMYVPIKAVEVFNISRQMVWTLTTKTVIKYKKSYPSLEL